VFNILFCLFPEEEYYYYVALIILLNMSFPHSESEKFAVDVAAKHAVESHGKAEYLLDPRELEMRADEHTGVELTRVELLYLKKVAKDRMTELKDKIKSLDDSIQGYSAPNMHNAEDEILKLKKELDFLEHNLAEKLFQE